MIRLIVVASLLALVQATAHADSVGRVFERTAVEMAPAVGKSFSEVVISNSLGDIQVEGYDGRELVIVAVKQAATRSTLERLKVSLVPEVDGAVHVQTRLTAGVEARPIAAGSVRVDLVVRVPRQATVRAKAWNGKVDAKELDNGAELVANEGEIRAAKILGRLRTENALGAQYVSDILGDVRARAMIGDVTLSDVRGPKLWAVVHRGDIKGDGISVREVYLRAFEGDLDIEVSPGPGARLQLFTFRGNVKVRSRTQSSLRIQGYARSGQTQLPDSIAAVADAAGRVHGQVRGRGAPAYISMGSRHGNVELVVLDSANTR